MNQITDHLRDRSQRDFVKYASQLNDENLAVKLYHLLNAGDPGIEKRAWAWPGEHLFPMDSKKDVQLSRLYFNGQREKIASDIAESIDASLSAREELMNLHNDYSFRMLKQANTEPVAELLPGYVIQGTEGLIKAGQDFEAECAEMSLGDRYNFSINFVKAACDMGVQFAIPESVGVYAGLYDTDKQVLLDQLEFRKVAAMRAGKDYSNFVKIAESIKDVDFSTATKLERLSLATTINRMDKEAGFTERKYDHRLPDAFAIVFNKRADEDPEMESNGTSGDATGQELSKADIVARYGDEALEALEDSNGEIDYEKLKQLRQLFGDTEHDAKSSEENNNGD